MASTAEALRALYERAKLMATAGPTLPVSLPEPVETFVPPADGKYLDVQVFTNAPAWQGMASGVLNQGLLQVTVVWPKSRGQIAPAVIADLVIAHFAKGMTLRSGATAVTINQQAWASSPLPEADDMRLPITIPWVAS